MLSHVEHHNRRFLDFHEKDYPHSIRLRRASVDPGKVQFHLPELAFICAPLAEYTEWRFRTEEQLRTFKSHYLTEETKL